MKLDLTKRLERSNVVSPSRLEADVMELRSVREDSTEDVSEHGSVCLDVFGLGGSVGPGHIEDVSDIGEGRQLGEGIVGIAEVALNVVETVGFAPGRARTACDAVDFARAMPAANIVELPWAMVDAGD